MSDQYAKNQLTVGLVIGALGILALLFVVIVTVDLS